MSYQLVNDRQWAASQPQVIMKSLQMHNGEPIWFTDFSQTAALIEEGRQMARRFSRSKHLVKLM